MSTSNRFDEPFGLTDSCDELVPLFVVGRCWTCGELTDDCFCDDFWWTEEERYET